MKLRIDIEIDDGGTPVKAAEQAVQALSRYVNGVALLCFIPSSAPLLAGEGMKIVGRAWVEQATDATLPERG